MTFNYRRSLLALLIVVLIIICHLKTVTCVRAFKENSRSKLKCLKNVTQTNTELASQIVPSNTNTKCITLSHPYCLDIKLPYNSIALLDSFPDLNLKSFDDINAFLDKWRVAQKLPTCWPMLQVALCSLLMPKCEEDPLTGRAVQFHQTSADICYDLTNANKTNCKMIQKQLIDDWSSLFTCNDTSLYAKNCSNELRDLTYTIGANSKPSCQYPLVPTNDNQNWFKDIDGCSLHCKFPVSSLSDQASISLVIKFLCLVGLITTIVAMVLFKVNRANGKSSRIAKVVKRCTICQFLIYIGWSLQTFVNHEVGCKADGSLLNGQPLVANSCILSFILTYLPSLSSLFWCAHLGKLCHNKLTAGDDKSQGSVELDRTLSLINYGITSILFVSVAFLGHIDGHGLYGICTVGQQSVIIKTIFVFLPSIICTVYGNYYFVRIIIKLALVRTTSMKPSLRRNFIRILALATLTTMQTTFSIVNYFYEYRNHQEWLQSLEHYVGCQLNLASIESLVSQHELTRQQQECSISSKPSVTFYYLEIISTLTIGIVISSWAFYVYNYRGFKRKLIDLLEDDKDRQRRAKTYLLQEPSAICRTNRRFTEKPGAVSDGTYHDLIDMTSPTRCGEVGGDGVAEVAEMAEAVEDVVAGSYNGSRISRRASFKSITISVFESENSSFDGYLYQNPHHSRGVKNRGKTSRDVVNDCRQQRDQNFVSHDSNQQHDPRVTEQMMLNILDLLKDQQFHPPDEEQLSQIPSIFEKYPYFHAFAEHPPVESE